MSRTFWYLIFIISIAYLSIDGAVAKYHLRIEQEWSTRQQEMIQSDLMIIGLFKESNYMLYKRVGELEDILEQLVPVVDIE